MNKEELKEWAGVKPADFAVYGATVALVAMYFTQQLFVDVVLALVAVGLCIAGCFMGMRSDARLSKFTNIVKMIAYPGCLLAAGVAIYFNFTVW